MTRPFIIDCDTGTDDAIALMAAFGCPEINVRAITSVNGNVKEEYTSANNLNLTEYLGIDVEVARGATLPFYPRGNYYGPTHGKTGLGDVVIPNGAVRMEGVSTHYLPIEYPAVPDFQVVKAVEQAAQKLEFPYNVGVTITKASFYTQTTPETKPVGPELVYKWQAYEKGGATSTSMECSVLFCVGASLGIRTSSVMISATNFGEYSNDADDYPSGWEERAIEVGIEAMKIMIRKDKAAANKQ